MNSLDIDSRSKEDIVEQIREKSLSYTPEWKMDTDNADIGTALALVYADMFKRTLKCVNNVPLKNRVSFFSQLGASLLPAIPSKGYISFSLAGSDSPSAEIPAGATVSADLGGDEGSVGFETTDDIYVTNSDINAIYQTDDSIDYISELFDSHSTERGEIVLFDRNRKNLQAHSLCFSHDYGLLVNRSAWIELCFFAHDDIPAEEESLRKLIDDQAAVFEYLTENGFVKFEEKFLKDGKIILRKNDKMPPFFRGVPDGTDEAEGYYIRCTVADAKEFEKLKIERFCLKTKGMGIDCDCIAANGIECDRVQFFPFGEKFSPYNEVYFGCRETLCKKGADINLSFNVDYARIPIEYDAGNDSFEWKWITDKSKFKPNRDYDITIEEIIWEYYNGFGWTRLFPDKSNSDIFNTSTGSVEQYKSMSFPCPDDIVPVLVGAQENYFIRARILKVNNLFKIKGFYISPMLHNVSFSYEYKTKWLNPQNTILTNGLCTERMKSGQMLDRGGFLPFFRTSEGMPSVYLGFERAPEGSPVKILFTMRANSENHFPLRYEYYSKGKWCGLNMVDETDSFSKTGIVTILDNDVFTKTVLFGKEMFWIRISDENGFYDSEATARPSILSFCMNTTKIINVDKCETERFINEAYRESTSFSLINGNIVEIEVYVNEVERLTKDEIDELKASRRARLVLDEAGIVRECWVKWSCADDFIDASESDRFYTVDKSRGVISFGNGKKGKIPPASKAENIIVEYKCGGGEKTNVAAGAVTKLNQTAGFVSEVRNPAVLFGGSDIETLDEALKRSSAQLRCQNKAVTARDFEEIARYSSRNIRSVKCFAGYDPEGNRSPGCVTLVVLQKNYSDGRIHFDLIKNEIYENLKGRVSGSLISLDKLYIIEPKFVELRVRAIVTVGNMNKVFSVKKDIRSRLDIFLNAFNGNFDGNGWKIGRLPNEIQIRNAISDIFDVEQINNIFINTFTNSEAGWTETDIDTVRNNKYILPLSGEHEIIINVSR